MKLNKIIGLCLVLFVALICSCNNTDNSKIKSEEAKEVAQNDIAKTEIKITETIPQGFESKMVEVNGINMHYLIGGKGDPLVLLHGFPETWYEYHNIMEPLSKEFTVIVPDLRGAGKTDKPLATVKGYPKKLLADDINQLVNKLGFKKIDLVGHDIGAMTAYAYAAMYPEQLDKVVLMDAPLAGINPFWSMINQDSRSWHFGFFLQDLAVDVFKGNEMTLIKKFSEELAYDPSKLNEENFKVYANYFKEENGLIGQFNWYRGFATDVEDNKEFSKKTLDTPVLGIGGEKSMGPMMEPLLKTVFNPEMVQTVSITEAGHWIVEEQPEQVINAIKDFLKN